jgi:glycosyltransferase involved in cell wall biosynthesis
MNGVQPGGTMQPEERGVGALRRDPPGLPAVTAVLVTHNRPQLMREALASILDQDYPGDIEVLVVYDRNDPDTSLLRDDGHRRVRVLRNDRTPGLAGARNTGILAAANDIIAFCDDDDTWLPGKLEHQVHRLAERPGAAFVTTAMAVVCDGVTTVRRADCEVVTIQDLARSRMAMLHSSSFVFRRSAMVDGFGLVDETLPRSMAEDWDLLIRAARMQPVEHVDEPLVSIRWGTTSYFNDAWQDKNAAHTWLLDRHPEIRADPVGAGLSYGKLAFGHAVLGHRREALRYAVRASRSNWREPRGLLAMAVVAGVPGNAIQAALNRRGRGI